MAPPGADPTAAAADEAELDRLGTELNACVMAQYAFTVVGLAVGTGLGIQRKSLLPLVGFGALGSVGDLLYGLGFACKPKLDAYRACRDRVQPAAARGRPPAAAEEGKR